MSYLMLMIPLVQFCEILKWVDHFLIDIYIQKKLKGIIVMDFTTVFLKFVLFFAWEMHLLFGFQRSKFITFAASSNRRWYQVNGNLFVVVCLMHTWKHRQSGLLIQKWILVSGYIGYQKAGCKESELILPVERTWNVTCFDFRDCQKYLAFFSSFLWLRMHVLKLDRITDLKTKGGGLKDESSLSTLWFFKFHGSFLGVYRKELENYLLTSTSLQSHPWHPRLHESWQPTFLAPKGCGKAGWSFSGGTGKGSQGWKRPWLSGVGFHPHPLEYGFWGPRFRNVYVFLGGWGCDFDSFSQIFIPNSRGR